MYDAVSMVQGTHQPPTSFTQEEEKKLTLQSTVLRISLSESLLRASVGIGWATICWRPDLAIAFLKDRRKRGCVNVLADNNSNNKQAIFTVPLEAAC